MGGKFSKEQTDEAFEDMDFDGISPETSEALADSDSLSDPENSTKRRPSVSTTELTSLFEQHGDVFLRFNQVGLLEKLTDEFHSNVYRGFYQDGLTYRDVQIKIPFNQRFTVPMAKKLAKNVRRHNKLRHQHIVVLFGFALSSEQAFVVSEFCPGGSLLSVLKHPGNLISVKKLGEWALQIAKGMEYLVSNDVVHGNLCAAICLLSDKNVSNAVMKISDFVHPAELGLSEFTVFPLRWTAPETIETGGGNTSHSGDVWSFGIVLWELFSGGKEPYPNIESNIVLQEHLINLGGVHEKPDRMHHEFYAKVMLPCLNHSSRKRPTFSDIVLLLQAEIPGLR